MRKITVIHHSADYDGLFSREVARKFLPPDTEFIGWDFGNPPLTGKHETVYVIDLPCDQPFGFLFNNGTVSPMVADKNVHGYKLAGFECDNLIWIDHHKTSIESHPTDIPGYRLEGVAACRLAWQWFAQMGSTMLGMPPKEAFINRAVTEPLAVRLAGEYDIWDKRDPRAELFQYGLDTEINKNGLMFQWLFAPDSDTYVSQIVAQGNCAQTCIAKRDADMMRGRSFKCWFEGLTVLALNIAKCNSLTFSSLDVPETGHDALMGFYWNGRQWMVSLYHAKHRKDIDLSLIAKKYGGGGHPGACGFPVTDPEFIKLLHAI